MIVMKINDGNGLSLAGFFEMKKEMYEIRNDEVFFCLLIDDGIPVNKNCIAGEKNTTYFMSMASE